MAGGEGVVMGVWWAALGLHAVVSSVVRRARVIARRGGVILGRALGLVLAVRPKSSRAVS